MNRKRTAIVGGAIVAVLAAGGAGVAAAASSGGGENEIPITGTALERASAAAVAEAGGGSVTETEIGDEEGYYEVEVTRPDGTQVDVHLDQNFTVLGTIADGDGSGSDDGDASSE